MRRFLIVAGVLALAGCTPEQREAWIEWFEADPRAAAEFAVNGCGGLGCSVDVEPSVDSSSSNDSGGDGDVPDEVYDGVLPGMATCGQWADEAWAAGWRDDGYTLGRVMWAESGCESGAYNPEWHWGGNATGLMQIIDPTWPNAAEACRGGLFDPVVNLRCALHIRDTQGWQAWVTY